MANSTSTPIPIFIGNCNCISNCNFISIRNSISSRNSKCTLSHGGSPVWVWTRVQQEDRIGSEQSESPI
ncbi:GD13667 [Drosophila simulans]|uniref:GD13667 n=1 Tax=Drosophila simulans TaxID=7240 RepID=B4NVM5_DROSI|nr:GD13667 [Drosophila simulans]